MKKGELVDQAYNLLAMNGALFNVSASNRSRGLQAMEMLIPSLERRGVYIGYNKSPKGVTGVDSNEDSGIVDTDVMAVVSNLSKLLCGMHERPVPQAILSLADTSLKSMYKMPAPMAKNGMMPMGAGNNRGRTYKQRFFKEDERIQVQQDGIITTD